MTLAICLSGLTGVLATAGLVLDDVLSDEDEGLTRARFVATQMAAMAVACGAVATLLYVRGRRRGNLNGFAWFSASALAATLIIGTTCGLTTW